MKVTLVNSASDGGGAAIAAKRLMYALSKNNIEVRFLVRDGVKTHAAIITLNDKPIIRFFSKLWNLVENLYARIFIRENIINTSFSINRGEKSISKHWAITNADIIHLHSLTDNYISLHELDNIFEIGKPIVWTMHDMWSFTGGCHYSGTCDRFKEYCSYCPFLRSPSKTDLSYRLFSKKKKLYNNKDVTIVTCSNWLKTQVEESVLLADKKVVHIPNPINTEKYRPVDRKDARNRLFLPQEKYLVLFGAANIEDNRKGLKHLIDGLKYLYENKPITANNMELVVFGKCRHDLKRLLPYDITIFNYISDQNTLIELYNAVDVFVLPSLEDNLPNTIMEAMACGIPVVGYNTGGIPEMIDHQVNGYLAEYKSSVDLADGIYWTLYQADYDQLSANARKKVIENYQEAEIASKYIELYKSLKK